MTIPKHPSPTYSPQPKHDLPDSAFTPEELAEVKALVVVRDEAYKASRAAALKIKAIEIQARLRQLGA